MRTKVFKISFKDLPFGVRKKIAVILKHRKQILVSAIPFGVLMPGFAGAVAADVYEKQSVKSVLEGVMLTGTTLIGGVLLRSHKEWYQKEELELYHSLKKIGTRESVLFPLGAVGFRRRRTKKALRVLSCKPKENAELPVGCF